MAAIDTKELKYGPDDPKGIVFVSTDLTKIYLSLNLAKKSPTIKYYLEQKDATDLVKEGRQITFPLPFSTPILMAIVARLRGEDVTEALKWFQLS
jgi:hypothetical protein